mgnify:CR=1 FL=1
MFTGLVSDVGEVLSVEERGGLKRLRVACAYDPATIQLGASIAHNGVCMTVVDFGPCGQGAWYDIDAAAETLAVTTAGQWRVGTKLNLERALKIGDELGGHLVSGHVDGVGRITAIAPAGDYHRVEIAVPPELAPLLAVKGSIAVDGISLTVNEAGPDRFAVTIIPHTWQHTTLGERRVGDAVNLEADMLARYVARQLACSAVP